MTRRWLGCRWKSGWQPPCTKADTGLLGWGRRGKNLGKQRAEQKKFLRMNNLSTIFICFAMYLCLVARFSFRNPSSKHVCVRVSTLVCMYTNVYLSSRILCALRVYGINKLKRILRYSKQVSFPLHCHAEGGQTSPVVVVVIFVVFFISNQHYKEI